MPVPGFFVPGFLEGSVDAVRPDAYSDNVDAFDCKQVQGAWMPCVVGKTASYVHNDSKDAHDCRAPAVASKCREDRC